MNTTKKAYIPITLLAIGMLAIALVVGTSITSAHGGERPELTDEQREVLEQAKELKDAGDIDGAKELLESAGIERPIHRRHHKFIQSLTDEQRDVLKSARELAQSGDREGAKELLEVAGIELPHQGDKPELTDEQKERLAEARELAQSGDREGAREILIEVFGEDGSFPGHHHRGFGPRGENQE